MSSLETEIGGLFSQDDTFKQILHDLMNDVLNNWTTDPIKSIVLGAPAGTGKTTVMKALRELAGGAGIATRDLTSTEVGAGLHTLSPDKFREAFHQLRTENTDRKTLIFVDEALREPTKSFLFDNQPTLLNSAHPESIRFLFMSAGFTPEFEHNKDWREFFRRTRAYYLSNLAARPYDIPYIIPARFFEKMPRLRTVRMAGSFVLAVTELALATPDASMLCGVADDIVGTYPLDTIEMTVTLEQLPQRYRAHRVTKGDFGVYEFHR